MNEQDKKCIKKYGENYLEAKHCIDFNHGKICETCEKDYLSKGIMQKCIVLDGEFCTGCKRGEKHD